MSKITEMLEAAEKVHAISSNARLHIELSHVTGKALPDIKRIVEFLSKDARHSQICIWWGAPAGATDCSCGLSEIQSLIRSDK